MVGSGTLSPQCQRSEGGRDLLSSEDGDDGSSLTSVQGMGARMPQLGTCTKAVPCK